MPQQTPQKRELLKHTLTHNLSGVLHVVIGLFVITTAATALFSAVTPATTTAATSSTLNFQARLESSSGAIAPDGNYNVQFKLYSVSSGGVALWTESYLNSASQGVKVANGYLTVNLGSITAFPGTINWDQDLYLTMNIGGTTGTVSYDGEMSPRLKLTGVPYAFQAKSAAQLQQLQGSYTGTLSFATLTGGNQQFVLPDQGAAGTYTLLTGATANSSYIQNTITQQVGANFYIDGTGKAAILNATTALQAPLLDTATATALNVGTTNAIGINLNQNTVLASGKTLTVNGASTFNLAATDALTVNADLSTGNRSTEAVLITQANNSTYSSSEALLSVKNSDTDSTAPAVNITQSASGGIALQIGGPPSASGTGILLGSSYTGGHALTISNLGNMTSGTGIKINGDGSSVSTAFTGQYMLVNPTRTYQGSGTITDTGNYLNIARSLTNSGTGTFANTGNLVDLSSNCTIVSGSCTDSGSIVNLNQQAYSSTGAVLKIQNAGSGNMISMVNGGSGATVASFDANGNLTAPTVNATVALQASLLDTATADILNIGTANATALNIFTGTKTGTINIGNNSGGDITIRSGGIIYGIGNAIFKPQSDSATAFQVQNAGGGTVFDVDSGNGYVGIGTTAPAAQLHVKAATTAAYVFIEGVSDGDNYSTLELRNTTGTSKWQFSNKSLTGHDKNFEFNHYNGTSWSTPFAITDAGRIGIGTTAPGYVLDTNGDINTATLYRVGGTAGLATLGCTGGQVLQNATIQGGIVTGGSCVVGGGGSGITTIGVIDGGTYSANGASISGSTLYLQSASATQVGLVTIGNQTFKGVKTFTSGAVINNTASTGTVPLTIQTAVDSRPLGSELMTSSYGFSAASGWTAISGTGQSATATHSTGNTTPLTINPAMSLTAGNDYQVSFTITGRTAGLIRVYVGGTPANGNGYGASGTSTFTTPTSGNLSFAVDSTFDGTISGVSIKQYTSGSTIPTALSVKNASGTTAFELRVTSDTSNLFLGLDAGSKNTVGTANTANGASALQNNTTGTSNTANGASALQNNTTGYFNAANGYAALQNNTTGRFNTANGYAALQHNTTADFNTAIGESALLSNTTGANNTASGVLALSGNTTGSNNTASGYFAGNGSNCSSGAGCGATGNALFGYQAGYSIQTGANYNLMQGYGAGYSVTTGAQNVLLGYNAGQNLTTGSNNIIIGAGINAASATGSNQLNIGNIIQGNMTSGSQSLSLTGNVTVSTTVNAVSGYKFNGTAGVTTSCTGGQFLQDATIQGGIVTGGSCVAGGGGITTIGAIDGGTYSANGASISGTTMYLQAAGTGKVGLVTTGTQNFDGNKTFNDTLTVNGATLIKTDSGAAFAVQNSAGTINLIHADTSANQVYLYDTLAQNLSVANNNGLYFNGYYDRTTTTDRYTSTGGAAQLYQDASSFYLLTAGSGTADAAISYINPFKVDLASGAATFSSTVNALSGYKFNGTAGLTKTCAVGEALVTATIQGGIVTSGSCVAGGGGGGVSSLNTFTGAITLQGTANQIVVTNSSGTITLKTPQDINTTSAVAFGSLTVGTAGNTVTIDSVNGYVATGTARHTKRVVLTPEFSGTVFSADGTNNVGFMQTDYDPSLGPAQGYKHNYYSWTTDQGMAQDYNIVVQYQLPSDFDGFAAGSFKLWNFVTTTGTNSITYMIRDTTGADCYAGGFQSITSTSATWTQAGLTDPANGCSFGPNDTITIIIQPSATAPTTNITKIGEFQYDYKAKF